MASFPCEALDVLSNSNCDDRNGLQPIPAVLGSCPGEMGPTVQKFPGLSRRFPALLDTPFQIFEQVAHHSRISRVVGTVPGGFAEDTDGALLAAVSKPFLVDRSERRAR